MSQSCIRCGFDRHIEGAEYCQNCGFGLDGNNCTNPHCVMNNDDEPESCPVDACYCPYCGSETSFFRDGIIKPINRRE